MLRGRHPVCFIAFDLLWLDGEDLRPLPLIERKARLKHLLRRPVHSIIAEAMSVEGRGKALMAAVEEYDLEGIVAKRKSDPYRRGVHGFKIKNRVIAKPMTGGASCSTATGMRSGPWQRRDRDSARSGAHECARCKRGYETDWETTNS